MSSRKMTRAQVRDLLLKGGAERHIERLTEIEEELLRGTSVTDPSGAEVLVPLDGARVAALKAAADLIWRRIDKVVPTPKAIELTGEEGVPLTMPEPDRLVLATKLLALVREKEEHDERVAEGELPAFLQ